MKTLGQLLHDAQLEAGSDSVAHKGNEWCTTMEANNPNDPNSPFWLQLHAGIMNFRFLHLSDPIGALGRSGITIPTGAGEPFYEPNTFCTINVEQVADPEIEAFVAKVFYSYFGVPDSQELNSSLEQLT